MTTEILKEIDSIIGLLETKFNPNHDPDNGRFAEGAGSFDYQSSKPVQTDIKVNRATAKEQALIDHWQRSLSTPQAEAVNDWQESGYKDIRSSEMSGDITPEIQGKIDNLNSALETAPDYDKPVYRGIKNLSADQMSQLANADEITLNAQTSFSGCQHTAYGFTNGYNPPNDELHPINSVYFEIQNPSGGKLIGATEREVLMPQGQTYNVVGREVIQYQSDRASVLHLTLEPK